MQKLYFICKLGILLYFFVPFRLPIQNSLLPHLESAREFKDLRSLYAFIIRENLENFAIAKKQEQKQILKYFSEK
jgi:hypothetical protein